MSLRIRLLALDLDGTMLDPGEHIQPQLVQALRGLVQRGLIVAIATGRPFADIVRIMEKHGLGARAGWPQVLLSEERDLHWLKDGAYEAYEPWNSQHLRDELAFLETSRALAARMRQEAEAAGIEVRQSLTELEETRGYVELYYRTREHALAAHRRAEELIAPLSLPIEINRNNRLIAFRLVGRGKGPVLAEACRVLGIPPEAVVAMGDSHNDATMLDGALGFRAATMANADPEIKELVTAAGGYIATESRGLGVLEATRHLIAS